jgi:hypothetical protein
VVVYAIFVDTRHTQPWSEYDINSTLDSIYKATNWIEHQAKVRRIPLEIKVDFHQNKRTIPIVSDFQNKTLSGTLFSPVIQVGIPKLDRWADRIAKIAGQSMPQDTSTIIKTKNKLNDRERLIAQLRNKHKTDNIVLMYFINNYYKEEISVTVHNESFTNTEYSIVSFKNPSVIAHEFLHIFGAHDLYLSQFDRGLRARKNKKKAMKMFPHEIMAFAYRNLDSLAISPFTRYLIGWDKELDNESRIQFLGKRTQTIRYFE